MCGEFGRLEFEINFTSWETAHTLYAVCEVTGYDAKVYLSG